ncbi:hypothetical protein BJY52DRAFT_1286919 [Lactarius psammicola]|nr:hypothetical protein BJY52DRAFT_1286919 [Lactarius psammicola]
MEEGPVISQIVPINYVSRDEHLTPRVWVRMGPYNPCFNPCDSAVAGGVPPYLYKLPKETSLQASSFSYPDRASRATMPSLPVDANAFIQYSEAVFSTVEGAATSSGSSGRPLCGTCGQTFGRPQDLRRHINDVHKPRRQCPFCSYGWSRADKIKAHLTDAHRDELSAEVLQGICALRGQAVVEFLDSFEYLRRDVMPQIYASSTTLFPSQF